MAEQVIVAADGGPASQSALDWIIDRSKHTRLAVEVVSVEELEWLPIGADESKYQARYLKVLSAAKATLSHHRGISEVATTLLTGDPAEALTVVANAADVLVLGSPRPRNDHGELHGTLALRVAAQAAGNIVIVPTGWQPSTGSIVAGVDEDESSDAAVTWAAAEALRTERDLLLVHCWSLPAPFSVLDGLLETHYPTLEGIHRNVLDAAVKRTQRLHPHLRVRSLLHFGKPASELFTIARAQAMLVVGHHQRGRLEHLFLGSVGHDLLLAASVPTAVIPAAEPHGLTVHARDSVIGGPDSD